MAMRSRYLSFRDLQESLGLYDLVGWAMFSEAFAKVNDYLKPASQEATIVAKSLIG